MGVVSEDARRRGVPGIAEIMAAVAWLVSEEAAWVTGQTIPVDGGVARA